VPRCVNRLVASRGSAEEEKLVILTGAAFLRISSNRYLMISTSMLEKDSPLSKLEIALAAGRLSPLLIARDTVERANSNASRNTYLRFKPDELFEQAATLQLLTTAERPPLFGIPISLKDCFDLGGTTTTCGSRSYAERNSAAGVDSGIALSLRRAGALITGKTHLHPLAYGITGQNPDFGDCLQPRDAKLLTGGSSSGAAASVQEGSALAAIGTDTGGSIRVPAALCGLVGYRASHSTAATDGWFPSAWSGAAHLAPSFDTVGFLLRDPRDAAPIAHALFGVPLGTAIPTPRIGVVPESFLGDCEAEVLTCFHAWKLRLASMGAQIEEIDTTPWENIFEIFAGIQAHEAAAIHRGNFDHFEPAIRDRLRWGASLTTEVLDAFHTRLQFFHESMRALFKHFDLLMLPAAPVSRLHANADLSDARRVILRYTTPFSLAGLPALSLPGEMIDGPFGTGVQIAAAPKADPMLLAYAAAVGRNLAPGWA
jgi:aspartyl-tRNA(Asn)/glutamyl-tRNA(Gln) amidotransferase subunit A